MAFGLLFWKLPFQERPLGTSSVFAARATSGSADAVTEPVPTVPFPFPEISWHYCSLGGPRSSLKQSPAHSQSSHPSTFPSLGSFSDLCDIMEVVFCYPSLPCFAQQCLVFWPKAMGLPKQLSSQFLVPLNLLRWCWPFPNIASADYADYLSHWTLLK